MIVRFRHQRCAQTQETGQPDRRPVPVVSSRRETLWASLRASLWPDCPALIPGLPSSVMRITPAGAFTELQYMHPESVFSKEEEGYHTQPQGSMAFIPQGAMSPLASRKKPHAEWIPAQDLSNRESSAR
jgi:hypothetical protein